MAKAAAFSRQAGGSALASERMSRSVQGKNAPGIGQGDQQKDQQDQGQQQQDRRLQPPQHRRGLSRGAGQVEGEQDQDREQVEQAFVDDGGDGLAFFYSFLLGQQHRPGDLAQAPRQQVGDHEADQREVPQAAEGDAGLEGAQQQPPAQRPHRVLRQRQQQEQQRVAQRDGAPDAADLPEVDAAQEQPDEERRQGAEKQYLPGFHLSAMVIVSAMDVNRRRALRQGARTGKSASADYSLVTKMSYAQPPPAASPPGPGRCGPRSSNNRARGRRRLA